MWERTKQNIERIGSALRHRWSALSGRQRLAAGAFGGAILVAAGIAVALVLAMGGGDTCDRPLCVEVLAPSGEEVPPMTPVRIRLGGDLDRQAAVSALQISNERPGQKRFEGDVLTFRPAWPGFARGERYDVALRIATEHLPQGADPVDISYRFTTEGKLAITSIFPPDGTKEIALDGAVMVQFNRSVAPLTVIAERGPAGVIEFDPPIDCEGRWLNTSLYTFRPDPGWAPSTTYTATVRRTATSWGAARGRPRLHVRHAVGRRADPSGRQQQVLAPSPEIEVTFNQPVDRTSAQAAFSLTRRGGAAAAGTFTWKDDATFVFRPSAPLALAAPYEAVIQAGVQAKEALAVTAEAARTRFETVGVPSVVSTTPKDGEQRAQPYSISIEFSNPMDQISVEDAFSLSPEPDFPPYFGWDERPPAVHRRRSTCRRTACDRAGCDRSVWALLPPLSVSFVTQPRDQDSASSGRGRHLQLVPDPTIAASRDVGQLDFALYRSMPRHSSRTSAATGRTTSHGTADPRTERDTADPPLDVAVTTATRLAAPGERLAQGFYYLHVSAPGTLQTDAMPFVVSSANVTTKWTEHDLLVWAVDLQTGAAIRGLQFDVLDRNAATIAKGTTDDEGVARVDVGASGDTYPGYYVSVQQGGITVLAGTNWTGTIGYPSVPFSFIEEHVGPVHRPPDLPAGRDSADQGGRPRGR
jgi:hypothetical protein